MSGSASPYRRTQEKLSLCTQTSLSPLDSIQKTTIIRHVPRQPFTIRAILETSIINFSVEEHDV